MGITTIQVSTKLKKELKDRKLFDNESYEEVIWDLIEDTTELSRETKKSIKEAEKDIKQGRVYTLEEVKNNIFMNWQRLF
jgi:predicted transcriptional regulator